MFDWPEQSHTSPTSRSPTSCARVGECAERECGPPAGMAGNVTLQRPDASARARCVAEPSVTVTSSPAFAVPQTAIGRSRWSTP
jgi:hypothetical protein